MSVFVICPMRDEWEHTRSLIWSLDAQTQRVHDALIIDNGSLEPIRSYIRGMKGFACTEHGEILEPRRRLRAYLHYTSRPDDSIYEMWNHGFSRARRLVGGRRPWQILVTNNDIRLPPEAVFEMHKALVDHPDAMVAYPDCHARWVHPVRVTGYSVTRGVWGEGGMTGACFMLAGDRVPWSPLVTDLSYEWWWGDNHLAECIEQEGGIQVCCIGLPMAHVNEATARHHPELQAVKLRDRGHWQTRIARGERAIERRAW